MTAITTDYTKDATTSTLFTGAMQTYRLLHWMVDTLKNFMSDAINIKDERLCALLKLQDGDSEEMLDALFKIDTPYSDDMRKAGTTPAIIVAAGDTAYQPTHFNSITAINSSKIGCEGMHNELAMKTTALTVSVATETYDGTVLLAGILEEFFCLNAWRLSEDCKSAFTVQIVGVSAPAEIKPAQLGNAKPIYQATISLKLTGCLSWQIDTQGPVFRGLDTRERLV